MIPKLIRPFLGLAACAAFAACSGNGPTAPPAIEGSVETTLAVQPDVAAVPNDPAGRVHLSVWPQEAGGRVTIEVCALPDGTPVAAVSGETCSDLEGRWTVARDVEGGLWIDRTWSGYATVRFERRPGQPPIRFRTTYTAPRGGTTRSVEGCTWTMAEHSDVGVACTSDREVRVLPWTVPAGPTAAAD